MEYATKECGECGALHPANVMTRISKRVSTGRSDRYSKKDGVLLKSGHTNHYTDRQVLLCPRCAEARRKARRTVWLLALVALIVVFWFVNRNDADNRESVETALVSEVEPVIDETVDYAVSPPEVEPVEDDPPTAPLEPPQAVQFVSNPVVQEVPESAAMDYPPCSETVTDNCIGE